MSLAVRVLDVNAAREWALKCLVLAQRVLCSAIDYRTRDATRDAMTQHVYRDDDCRAPVGGEPCAPPHCNSAS
eukprot:3098743-Rhodomonas_salina.2